MMDPKWINTFIVYLNSNNKLRNVVAIGEEAERVARDTKVNLHSNSDKLRNIQGNVNRVRTELTLSDRLINIIRRNETKNKIILYCIILFLLIAAIVIVYFGVFRK
mmetsp:Transcript_7771/g.7337  ORF Transcript_7771/g.7337 Transcript_7771/m.7337 type:complete len:106 (-) Transcript_7771:40-357(-)